MLERCLHQAMALLAPPTDSPVYRGSPRVDEGLELLRINDYQTLLKRKSKLIRGSLTWASVAAVVIEGLATRLLNGGAERALDAADDAHTLAVPQNSTSCCSAPFSPSFRSGLAAT